MNEPVYRRVRRYVDEQGISRKQLAISMHISESKLSLILGGQRRLTVDEYVQMCHALALPPGKFLDAAAQGGASA